MVTNDDGIDSPGMRMLATGLAGPDTSVLVVAPDRDMSGSGTAIGGFDPRVGVQLRTADIEGVDEAFSVDGPPGLAVLATRLGAFGRTPDLVVSGINAGMNTGHSVIHSGTVGAALTAVTLGMHGLAVSLAWSDVWHWETAVEIGRAVASLVIQLPGPPTAFNLNVPPLPLSEVAGLRWAALADSSHIQVAVADVPGRRLDFEVRGSVRDLDPATDTVMCRSGFATLTRLSTVEPLPHPEVDLDEVWTPSGT